jgi:hypothetical protein
MSENCCPFVEPRYALLEQTFVHFNGASLTERAMGSKERARSIGHTSLWHERVYNTQDWNRSPHASPPLSTKWEKDASGSDVSTDDSWQPHHQGRDCEIQLDCDSASSNKEVTLMVRNFPAAINRQNLIEMLNQTGFAGTYNAVYMPMNLRSGGCHSNRGHAFVNMKKAVWATELAKQWHKQPLFGTTINVSPAEVQGLDACMKLWNGNKTRRIRNPACRPAFFP